MKKRIVAIGLVLAFLIGCGAYYYRQYDNNHLSSDLKRTLIAAAYPTNSFAQIDAYLHEARLQIHTHKDAVVYEKFSGAVHLAEPGYSAENEAEAKRLFDEVRADLGLTVFKLSWLPLFPSGTR